MTYTTMWAYPWDMLDDGVHDVTRRMREDIGLDAVSVATSYHSVEHLRPHTKGTRMFSTIEGGIYFQPDADLWQDVSLQPSVAPMAAAGNPLEDICAAADRAGLRVESWTVCLHNSHMGRQNPAVCERNACGGVDAPRLCPSNPRVRENIPPPCRALVTNYALCAIEWEAMSGCRRDKRFYLPMEGLEQGNAGRSNHVLG